MKKWLIAILSLSLAAYLSVPLVVLSMAGQPSDPLERGWSGTVTSAGSYCMRQRAQHTLSFVPRIEVGNAVCEIGPGRGILAAEAKKMGLTYWALDMDEAALTSVTADRKFLGRVPPMPEMPYPPAAIVIESVLEHMKDSQEVSEVLSECYETLAQGGVVVIRVPEVRYARWRFWDAAPDHTYVTSKRRMATLLRGCGFTIAEHGYYLDQFTGFSAQVVYRVKSLWPWGLLDDLFYEPWQESAFSKIAEKTPACYIVGRKGSL